MERLIIVKDKTVFNSMSQNQKRCGRKEKNPGALCGRLAAREDQPGAPGFGELWGFRLAVQPKLSLGEPR